MNSVFYQDMKDRKTLSRGSYSRVCGSKSKKCDLGSDHLTQSEWKKRNGEVMTYDLRSPMGWQRFRAMPTDIQKEYIENLTREYHATMSDLGKMFGVHRMTVANHLKDRRIQGNFYRGPRSAAKKEAWSRFMSKSYCGTADVKQEADDEVSSEPETAQEVPVAVPQQIKRDALSEISMTFSGDINMAKIVHELDVILRGRNLQQMVITCKVGQDTA